MIVGTLAVTTVLSLLKSARDAKTAKREPVSEPADR